MKQCTCLMFAFFVSSSFLAMGATVEKPQVLPDVSLSIAIPDLHGFIDEVGAMAAKASPMMNGPLLKSMIGMQLGDPNLAGIAPGSGLAIAVLDMTNSFAVIEVSQSQSSNYVNMVQAKGMSATYKDGLLVVAQTPELTERGLGMVSKVKAALLAKRSPTMRIALQPGLMIERNREAIDGFVNMMPMLMAPQMMQAPGATLESTQSTMNILMAELNMLLSLAGQCDAMEVVLAPKNGSLRIDKTLAPKAGTRLGTLIDAPVVHKENPKVHAGVLGGGTFLLDFTFSNPEVLTEFVLAEAKVLIEQLKIEAVDADALLESIGKWFVFYGGSGCEAIRFSGDGKMDVAYIVEVKDQEKAIDLLKNLEKEMAPLFKLYENLGISMKISFVENVRELDGMKVHRLSATMNLDAMPAEQREQMKAMGLDNMVYDIAVGDGIMFYAGEGKLEELVKQFKDQAGAEPIKARGVYPSGGFYYADLDFGGYLAFAATLIPEGPELASFKQMVSVFVGAEPITSAGFRENGAIMWSMNIPGDLLAKFGQMAMMMQMQKMQQQQMGVPGAMPAP